MNSATPSKTIKSGRLPGWLWIVAALILVQTAAANGPESLPKKKPESPVQVRLETLNTPRVGEAFQIRMRVTSRIDTPLLTVAYRLPEGIEVIAGERRWQGSLKRGETRALVLAVRVNEARRVVIEGIATVELSSDTRHVGIDSIVIDLLEIPESDREKSPPIGIVPRSRDGIIELPGE